MKVGIDASNIRAGGGVTHLVEILRIFNPAQSETSSVVVWGGRTTLDYIDDQHWLEKKYLPTLDKGLFLRALWQRFFLSKEASRSNCDILFIPGGSYSGNFHPAVTMSQNMLPFEWRELTRYGLSLITLKLVLLRWVQSQSYRRVDGVIFLTEYARKTVEKIVGTQMMTTTIIPHGIHGRFFTPPVKQTAINDYSPEHPFRVLYVSIVTVYKHQWNVSEAVRILRESGFPVVLDLVGPAYAPALKRLNNTLDRIDPKRQYIHYAGSLSHDMMHEKYAQADMFIFASSCENMPNILLEGMASGAPVASSNKGPMPEILGEGGVYFDPENPDDIARAIKQLIESPDLRRKLAECSYRRSSNFSWSSCAKETFDFLSQVVRQSNQITS